MLPALFAQVQVPQAVLDECFTRPENADAVRIQSAIGKQGLTPCDATPITAEGLDLGERAAIARAVEINAGLLADDRAARQHAMALGLVVIGTLGVLVLAKRAGHVAAITPLVEQLRASGQRLSHAAVAQTTGCRSGGGRLSGILPPPPLKPIPIKERVSVVFIERGEIDMLDGTFVVVDANGIRTHIPWAVWPASGPGAMTTPVPGTRRTCPTVACLPPPRACTVTEAAVLAAGADAIRWALLDRR